jgi:predicted secreted protein
VAEVPRLQSTTALFPNITLFSWQLHRNFVASRRSFAQISAYLRHDSLIRIQEACRQRKERQEQAGNTGYTVYRKMYDMVTEALDDNMAIATIAD